MIRPTFHHIHPVVVGLRPYHISNKFEIIGMFRRATDNNARHLRGGTHGHLKLAFKMEPALPFEHAEHLERDRVILQCEAAGYKGTDVAACKPRPWFRSKIRPQGPRHSSFAHAKLLTGSLFGPHPFFR